MHAEQPSGAVERVIEAREGQDRPDSLPRAVGRSQVQAIIAAQSKALGKVGSPLQQRLVHLHPPG